MTEPLVYVLVINWNGVEHLDECFETLLAGTYQNARFLLVDNASEDGSVAFVREKFGSDPRVEILELERNLGWSGGNNAGMGRALESKAEYVLLLNNDTAIAPDAIGQMVAACLSDPDVGALAPKILLYENPQLLNSMGLEATDVGTAWDRGIGRLDGERWGSVEPVVGVCGAAFFLRVETLRKTGLLPTDFEIYLDDLDLSLRVWNAGYRIVTCPKAVVRHKFSSTMGEGRRARRKYYLNTRNRMRLIQRNYPVSRIPSILAHYAGAECRAVVRAMLDRELWRVGAHARSWFDALRYIPEGLRERRRRKESGLHECRFWDFIRSDLRFFPGVPFPVDGWYESVTIAGKTVRPMSETAYWDHAGGRLELTQVNPHPHLNSLRILITCGDEQVVTLAGSEPHTTLIEAPEGRLTFHAQTIFSADQTLESYDIGGWIGVRAL